MSIYDTPDDPNRTAGPGELRSDPDYDGPRHERDPDADRETLLDAEWLEGQQEAAFKAAKEGGMFQEQGCFYSGNLLQDCAAASFPSQMMQIHADYCLANGIPQGPVYKRMAEAFKPRDGEK